MNGVISNSPASVADGARLAKQKSNSNRYFLIDFSLDFSPVTGRSGDGS
jgi:hypothetical protein